MYSLSIDYLFNRVYDVLLWIKYVWLFVLLRKNPDEYLVQHADRSFDGLRDRGWFDAYLAEKDAVVPQADVHISLWQKMLQSLGVKLPDSDGDGISDAADPKPYDPENLSAVQLKERYQEDYTFGDYFRDAFGVGPKDSDKDSVPNSYELAHNLDPNNPDTDRDGLPDGQELVLGTNPLNNDFDGDRILDGRDAFPADGSRSIEDGGIDSDTDGISDKAETYLLTDPNNPDSDGDGIPDGMDTYPLDVNNMSQIPAFDMDQATSGVQFVVQNPILSFLVDILSIATIAIIILFVYVVFRWLLIFLSSLNHYDHHFVHDDHHGAGGMHIVKDDTGHGEMPAGIPGLPIAEEVPLAPPKSEVFKEHPRWAIIKGYMSSPSEALWRIGILEADNMLAEILKEKGYAGETVSDMLKNANFGTVRMAWDAHMVRNMIAHEGSTFILTERDAKRAFMLYESVFRELKAIE